MKMNYHLIHSRIRRRRPFGPLSIGLTFVALIVLLSLFNPSFLREGASAIAAPFWRTGLAMEGGVGNFFAFFTSRQALLDELSQLRSTLVEREAGLRELAALKEENVALKKQSLVGVKETPLLLALVLATPPRSPYDTVILDAGREKGVAVGDEALWDGVLVGEVSEVVAQTSTVSLFSTSGKKVSLVAIHEGRSIPLEAEGQGGGSFLARLPRDVPIAEGDQVHMSERPLAVFGEVTALKRDESDPFIAVYVKSVAPFSGLRFLSLRRLSEK